MIDPHDLKLTLTHDPKQDAPGTEEVAIEPAVVRMQCPVCHWGLEVTVTPVEVVG